MNKGKNHTTIGYTSLFISIISFICLLVAIIYKTGILLNLLYLSGTLSVIAVIIGVFGYWGKNRKDRFALTGFLIGLIEIFIIIIFLLMTLSSIVPV